MRENNSKDMGKPNIRGHNYFIMPSDFFVFLQVLLEYF